MEERILKKEPLPSLKKVCDFCILPNQNIRMYATSLTSYMIVTKFMFLFNESVILSIFLLVVCVEIDIIMAKPYNCIKKFMSKFFCVVTKAQLLLNSMEYGGC